MKIIFFLFILIFSAAARSHSVVTSFSILADITQNILPAEFKVESLVPKDMDPHGYQMTTRDFLILKKADFIILVGEHFDPWIEKALPRLHSKAKAYYVTKQLKLTPGDPHFWQSLELTWIMTQNLSNEFIEKYPDHKDAIAKKTTAYLNEIKKLQTHYKSQFDLISKEKRQIVVAHNSFQYFSKEFGVRILSPLDTHMHGEVSLNRVGTLIEQIKNEKIKGLFLEKSVSKSLMEKIAKSTKNTISGTLYSDALSESTQASTYLKLIETNYKLILQALK